MPVTVKLAEGAPLCIGRGGELIHAPPQISDKVYMVNTEGTCYETGIITATAKSGRERCSYICPLNLPNGEAVFIPNGSMTTNSTIIVNTGHVMDMVSVSVQFHDPEKKVVCVFGVNVQL
jgi:hypothetical protein